MSIPENAKQPRVDVFEMAGITVTTNQRWTPDLLFMVIKATDVKGKACSDESLIGAGPYQLYMSSIMQRAANLAKDQVVHFPHEGLIFVKLVKGAHETLKEQEPDHKPITFGCAQRIRDAFYRARKGEEVVISKEGDEE